MIQTTIYRPIPSLQKELVLKGCGELSHIGDLDYEKLDESIKQKIKLKNYSSDIGIESVCKSIEEMISNFNSNLINHEDGVNSFMAIEPGDVVKADGKFYFINSEGISQIENFE